MPDILHDLPIRAEAPRVFAAVSTPHGLNQWWTLHASGEPSPDAILSLSFGAQYNWRAVVTCFMPHLAFELHLIDADDDWVGTRVGFALERRADTTWVRFHHSGWAAPNEHYRTSCTCWALYLRLLRRYLEHGETVPYERRLDA